MNLYAYAGNNPIAFDDPFGLCAQVGNCIQGDKGLVDALDHVEAAAARTPFSDPHSARVLADPRSSTSDKVAAALTQGFMLPGVGGGLGMVSEAGEGASVLGNWHKATFPSEAESAAYHLERHGGGRTLGEYTKDAVDYFKANSQRGVSMTAKDGADALKIKTPGGGPGGIFTALGKIITFWYK